MMLWRLLWRLNPLLLAVMVGCAGVPRVRVETERGRAVIYIPRTTEVQPVEVEEEEFQQAMRQLARQVRRTGTPRQTAERMFQIDPLSGNYLYLLRDKKLVPTGPGDWDGTLTRADVETAERYLLWCQRTHGVHGDCLGGALVAGRYLDMQGRYMWAMALSKSPVLDEMKRALGDMVNVQALISTALWTLGSILLILALNPVAPALVAVLGTVEEIALTDESVTVTMPASAMAMAARGMGGQGPCIETHHLATVCNDKGSKRGGPWTPRFRKIFAKAGMTLEDPANKMPLEGHYGPHPEEYHRRVFQELSDATKGCRTVAQCRSALLSTLEDLAQEIATPGTELNQLVTRS
ncbi:MAG: AHH domain-containing protein [Hyalangium sp.]|uniref:AHH domain-containing protein n=1 Tax=Hyalangium sp. TaxID=2028555 RepID=UPI003899D9BB